MEVQGGGSNTKALKQTIQKNLGIRVRIKDNTEIIYVIGIEVDVNREDIERSIAISVGNGKDGDVRVLSVKPNERGCQNVKVAVRKGLESI